MTRVAIPRHGELTLPVSLLHNLRAVHGERVERWLADLPATLATVLDEHGAQILPGEPPLSYHLVFFAALPGGEQVVYKCTVPNDEQPPELMAVRALSDAGIGPRLLWQDLGRGILMMERVTPGEILPTGLPSLDEDARIVRQVAALAARMAREAALPPDADALVPVRRYSRALGTVDPATPLWRAHRAEIERALALRDSLLAAAGRRDVFLHGDLHHYNVLKDARHGLRVIDPKGLVGPAGYEFGALTYNPVGIQRHPRLGAITRQRIDIWAEVTGLPWETVRSWGYVCAVLSACWSGEGGGVAWKDAMTIALTLRDLAPVSRPRR